MYETDRCFVIYGWMPSAGVEGLRKDLVDQHGDVVVVEEREILKKDLDEVPVALRNSPYFRPFELMVRCCPRRATRRSTRRRSSASSFRCSSA